MKVSIDWLKELVELNVPIKKLLELIPLRIQGGIKEVKDNYFELDLKGYNRADLLSMRGVAYEVAAITNSSAKFETFLRQPGRLPHESTTPVTVENENLCPVYCLAKIEGLEVDKSSPAWVKKLTDSGMRSINNITDVTNLVMLEYGQPLHAFDAEHVKDETLIVRTARTGEKLDTLDGKTRDLMSTDLLIADPQKALGLAGVMGGQDSEVTNSTSTILLEAAIFDPISLRQTSQRLGLHSEASKRFQHGLTKTRLLQALDTAIKMYQDLGGKLTAITIVGDTKDPVRNVRLSLDKTNSLIGIELTPKQVEEYLTRLGFKLASKGKGDAFRAWNVGIPYWRLDIEIEEDLIEEVARMYGYENIPAKPLVGELPGKIDQSLFNLISCLKDKLVDLGLTEVQTYSFYSTKALEALAIDKSQLVKVANPMSAETEYLRGDLWPNLVEVVDKNLRQGFTDIAVFEIGKVYSSVKDDVPKEKYCLSISLMNGLDNPLTELTSILDRLELSQVRASTSKVAAQSPLFHPTRQMSVYTLSVQSGIIAEIHPKILDKFGIGKRVAVLEVKLILL